MCQCNVPQFRVRDQTLILNGGIIHFRFWWDAEGVFTQQQKAELLKGSLSRIICDNSDIREIPPDPFMFRKYPSEYVSCDHISSMNLNAWREEKSRGGFENLSALSRYLKKIIHIL